MTACAQLLDLARRGSYAARRLLPAGEGMRELSVVDSSVNPAVEPLPLGRTRGSEGCGLLNLARGLAVAKRKLKLCLKAYRPGVGR